MDTIQLSDIRLGTPGISPIEGANLYENCIVAMHNSGHLSPVILQMEGIRTEPFSLIWEDSFNDQLRRTYNDEQSVTERAAIAVSVMLAIRTTSYTVIERSRKGTGFDYMLGDDQNPLFVPEARLEVSGIMRETNDNTIASRFQQKCLQTERSDDSCLPAFVSVVEFSIPKAIFDKTNNEI